MLVFGAIAATSAASVMNAPALPALAPDEMLTDVRFPLWAKGHGHAFVEFSRRHGDFAVVSAAALLEADRSGRITRAALTIGGAGPTPVRARDVERALVGNAASPGLFRNACGSLRSIDAVGDVYAPAEYRQQLAVTLASRALEKAHSRMSG
jgi:carbon-monoxide dehydrogenase medium subunit